MMDEGIIRNMYVELSAENIIKLYIVASCWIIIDIKITIFNSIIDLFLQIVPSIKSPHFLSKGYYIPTPCTGLN